MHLGFLDSWVPKRQGSIDSGAVAQAISVPGFHWLGFFNPSCLASQDVVEDRLDRKLWPFVSDPTPVPSSQAAVR